jgi:Flp pilus assembly protein TadG
MSKFNIIRRDEQGAAAIEFALAVPVLIMMIWGIFQVGLLYGANAGMQHALGEGARYTTLYPTPTDAQIRARISSKVFGTKNGTFTVATPVSGVGYKDLSVTYSAPTHFLFMSGPTVTLTRTKKVYVAT